MNGHEIEDIIGKKIVDWINGHAPLKVKALLSAIAAGIIGFFLFMMAGCTSDVCGLRNRVESIEYQVESNRLRITKAEKKLSYLVMTDHTDRAQSVGPCVRCPLCGSTRPAVDAAEGADSSTSTTVD